MTSPVTRRAAKSIAFVFLLIVLLIVMKPCNTPGEQEPPEPVPSGTTSQHQPTVTVTATATAVPTPPFPHHGPPEPFPPTPEPEAHQNSYNSQRDISCLRQRSHPTRKKGLQDLQAHISSLWYDLVQ